MSDSTGTYEAMVMCASVRSHPNADRMRLVILDQYQVISSSVQEGELVVFFRCDGQLDPEFLSYNSEYRSGEGINRDPKKFGFFDSNGRVKMIKLRGEYSHGYVVPLSSFDYCGPVEWREGMTFSELNGHHICHKYITQATRDYAAKNKPSKNKGPKVKVLNFPLHFHTKSLRDHLRSLPIGAVCYFTEKLHGTSGRTGYVQAISKRKLSWWESFKLKIILALGGNPPKTYVLVSGSRNNDFAPGGGEFGYRDVYREKAEAYFAGKLHCDEVIYYEIVGYGINSAIQKHGVNAKTKDPVENEILARYGSHIPYSYGCAVGESETYVYRITQNGRELSWIEIQRRCSELGVKPVPVLSIPMIVRDENSRAEIMEICKSFGDAKSSIGDNPCEGVCLRVEAENIHPSMSILKCKGNTFMILEGKAKDDSAFIDIEEAS